jgi:predicted HTH domain antitoxin
MSDTFQYTVTLPRSVKPYLPDPELDTKLLIAVKLYQDRSVSIGRAVEISGIGRYAFETYLSDHKIPISNLTLEQVMADVASIKELRGKGKPLIR